MGAPVWGKLQEWWSSDVVSLLSLSLPVSHTLSEREKERTKERVEGEKKERGALKVQSPFKRFQVYNPGGKIVV